jgi:signal transduction histidine kinase
MRERAEQMGGVMKLRSLAGQGTEIIIELPVPDDSA